MIIVYVDSLLTTSVRGGGVGGRGAGLLPAVHWDAEALRGLQRGLVGQAATVAAPWYRAGQRVVGVDAVDTGVGHHVLLLAPRVLGTRSATTIMQLWSTMKTFPL